MDMGSVGSVPAQTNLPPAVVKAERDVVILKRQARFVICLDDAGGYKVLESSPEYHDTIPLVVVVGKVCTDGVAHEASLLEIGYKRARPYRRIRASDKIRTVLYDRVPFHQLDLQQQRLIYPEIFKCLEMVLRETQAGWKSNEPWWVTGDRVAERGVRISVDKRDRWLYREFLREDSRYHQQCLFKKMARTICFKLRHCKYVRYSSYPKSAVEVADFLHASAYKKQPRLFEVLLRMMPPSRRMLLESVLMDRHNFLLQLDQDEDAALAFDEAERLPFARHPLFFHRHVNQPDGTKWGHAANCARFVVFYDWLKRSRHVPTLTRGWVRRRLVDVGDEPPF